MTFLHPRGPKFDGATAVLAAMPLALSKPAVLIIGGHAPLRRALRRLLHGLNIDLLEVATGTEALALLEQQNRVAAVITDQDIGTGPTGLELLEEAQRRHPGVGTFVYTGERLLTVEVWRWAFVTIAKPVPVGRLRQAIEQAVRP